MRITIFCTRVKVSNVMTCAHFGVDILRDVGSGGGTNLVYIAYHTLFDISFGHQNTRGN